MTSSGGVSSVKATSEKPMADVFVHPKQRQSEDGEELKRTDVVRSIRNRRAQVDDHKDRHPQTIERGAIRSRA
jgi:hypothetical protein